MNGQEAREDGDSDVGQSAVLKIEWSSGVTSYLKLSNGEPEIATEAPDGGWNTRAVDSKPYLSDVRRSSAEMSEIPLQESPWGNTNDR